jgi:hypothetical protein
MKPAAVRGPRPVAARSEQTLNPNSRIPGFQESGIRERLKMKGEGSMRRDECLQEIEGQYRMIRDRLRSVVGGLTNGMYLFGPPGISKTYTVRKYLESQSVPHKSVQGYMTGSRLFGVIEENPDGIIVLDDVTGIITKNDKGVPLLLAALGSPPDGSRVRRVTYGTAREERVVEFTGGIIAISNLGLEEHRNDVIKALRDRVYVQRFDPTPEQVAALIHEIAKEGPAGVAAEDATTVAEFLVAECRRQGTRLTIRLFIEKALPDFRLWSAEASENHWRDLVRATVAEEFVPQEHQVRDMSRRDRADADRRIVLTICNEFVTAEERLRAWTERTGRGKTGFYRHYKPLKNSGLVSHA